MMLQLKAIDSKVRKEYADRIIPGLVKRIRKGRVSNGHLYELSNGAKAILLPNWDTEKPDNSILEKLLTSEPEELYDLNLLTSGSLNRLDVADRPDNKTLEIIFGYDCEFVRNREQGYWLAKKIGKNTCTYCNRQYVFTIESIEKDGSTRLITRPAFDHWFPKSGYPLMSLSIHNLIPTCTICNSSVKGSVPMSLDTHIHPYVPDPEASDFRFRATRKISDKPEWRLVIDRNRNSKLGKTIKDLALEEIYSPHAELEVKDIMEFYDAYNSGYINDIVKMVDRFFAEKLRKLSKKEVYRILFGVCYDEEEFLDRPLSKLKRDLLEQIGLDLK